ncbi:MAG: isochorismate synthase [Chloroflexi bacterium]|nr:isochorismate synthase [Chloroflexota bacterium]
MAAHAEPFPPVWRAHRRPWPVWPVSRWLAQVHPPVWVWWTPAGWGYVAWGAAQQVHAEGAARYARVRAAVEAGGWTWAADAVEAPPEAEPRWFGGFAFDPRPRPSQGWWTAFGHARFFLPRYLYAQSPTGRAWLTVLTRADEVPRWPSQTATARSRPRPWPARLADEEGMTRAQWRALVRDALEHLRRGALHKVVLARTQRLRWHAPPPWEAVWTRLDRAYPRTYRFLYRPGADLTAFVGASPELLVRVRGRSLETMALAGSIARGRDPAEDAALAAALLASAKDRHEHAWVVQAIREALAPLTETLEVPPEPQVRQYANIQHLYTPIRGLLRRPGVWEAVERLHPTPALGGYPRAAALAFIAAHEPVPRGWYAAPLGWVTPNGDGEFVGAIRCAVLRANAALLYAGAGIVADSDPEREWEEIDLKFRAMRRVLGEEDEL